MSVVGWVYWSDVCQDGGKGGVDILTHIDEGEWRGATTPDILLYSIFTNRLIFYTNGFILQ